MALLRQRPKAITQCIPGADLGNDPAPWSHDAEEVFGGTLTKGRNIGLHTHKYLGWGGVDVNWHG